MNRKAFWLLLLTASVACAAEPKPVTSRQPGVAVFFESAQDGDRSSIRDLLTQYSQSDGHRTEEISAALGAVIANHPVVFLEELNQSTLRTNKHALGSLVANTGEALVDRFEEQKSELERRRKALTTVKETALAPLRDRCIAELDAQIKIVSGALEEQRTP